MKHRVTALATVALLAACGEAPGPTQPNADALVQVPSHRTSAIVAGASYTTVGASTYTVPAGVTSLTVVAVGGGGGGAINTPGGAGALVTTTLSVTPGQILELFVGAGYGGLTNWSVGGGGSTNILSGGVPLVIAGGGGGGGQHGRGGNAGGPGGVGGNGITASGGCGRNFCSGTGGIGGIGGIGGGAVSGTSPYGIIWSSPGGNGNGGCGAWAPCLVGAGAGVGGAGGFYGGGGGGGYGGGSGGGSVSGGGAGGSFGPAGTTYASAGNGGAAGTGGGGNGSIEITPSAPSILPTTTSVTFGTGPFVYTGSAFTATASVSPAAAGTATIAYSGDCTNAGNTCQATATYAGNGNFLPSSANTNILITLPVATSDGQCKKGGWQFVTDDLGNLFKNQGDCVSYVATKGKNKGAGAP